MCNGPKMCKAPPTSDFARLTRAFSPKPFRRLVLPYQKLMEFGQHRVAVHVAIARRVERLAD